ncbi:PREDICTED: LOW QUALITY PROTEIN: sialic acid-binding Ig-like lectin 11 [Miniopterus natalensis]|uniref:LOW QUALITY PROTEIN: sialic acid-binding Ig-like lectin 11 n=1 Tax=Miniopterus natalensis TaxID=291302 RepID=UPI0007A72E6A|nr:PREDICTED: LOW QUALITY PROTEIN: sialic acid-binding Ig-like lectin 11 [Miniopterus natalensis]
MLLLLLPLLWAGSLQQGPGYKLQAPALVRVQEGLCIHVPCTVSYPSVGWNDSTPVRGYWFQKRDKTKKDVLVATNNQAKKVRKDKALFYLSGDLGAGNCSLSIADAHPGDRGKYYFHLERGNVNHTYRNNLLTVAVEELTQSPDIHVEEPLESGCPSRLMCSMPGACAGARAHTVSWAGAALRPPGLGLPAYNSSEIRLTPRPQDHGTNLTCRVTVHRAISREKTIRLNVSYAPQSLTVSAWRGDHTGLEPVGNGSSLLVREGDPLRLLCVADSNPPATLSWAQDGQTLSPSQPWKPGVLELFRVEPRHEGEFTCRAQHRRGSLLSSLRLWVQSEPQLLGPSCSWEDQGLTCSCSSRAQPAPSLRWKLGEELLEGNRSEASYTVTSRSAGPWTNSSLSLSRGLSADLRLSCEARNDHGAQSAAVLLLPGQGLSGQRLRERGMGKPFLRETFVLGAVGGAGVAGLLILCLCCISFRLLRGRSLPSRVKSCRKDAPEAVAGDKDAPCTPGPISQLESNIIDYDLSVRFPHCKLGHQYECLPGSLDHPPGAAAAPTSGEELELHYASLSFQGLRPGEPPDQEATSTEYAEIKIRE